MMWRRSLSRPGAGGLPTASHSSRDLTALPGLRREAQNLDLHTTAFECPRQDIGAASGDHDRPAAHRTRIIEKQRHDGVAEIRFALAFIGERAGRIGDDAGEARRIEHAFLEIEIPAAVLLRQQPALQLVRKLRDGGRQRFQFLVEERA